jgi:hypothetical protein
VARLEPRIPKTTYTVEKLEEKKFLVQGRRDGNGTGWRVAREMRYEDRNERQSGVEPPHSQKRTSLQTSV